MPSKSFPDTRARCLGWGWPPVTERTSAATANFHQKLWTLIEISTHLETWSQVFLRRLMEELVRALMMACAEVRLFNFLHSWKETEL